MNRLKVVKIEPDKIDKIVIMFRRLICRHDYLRRADLDHLFDFGRNKRYYWICSKCGKEKSEVLY